MNTLTNPLTEQQLELLQMFARPVNIISIDEFMEILRENFEG